VFGRHDAGAVVSARPVSLPGFARLGESSASVRAVRA